MPSSSALSASPAGPPLSRRGASSAARSVAIDLTVDASIGRPHSSLTAPRAHAGSSGMASIASMRPRSSSITLSTPDLGNTPTSSSSTRTSAGAQHACAGHTDAGWACGAACAACACAACAVCACAVCAACRRARSCDSGTRSSGAATRRAVCGANATSTSQLSSGAPAGRLTQIRSCSLRAPSGGTTISDVASHTDSCGLVCGVKTGATSARGAVACAPGPRPSSDDAASCVLVWLKCEVCG
mmetsp:Transcript_30925/g.92002  ORF Transcript_30925/g.92002 Transcript_30925/m.92002 type:complete len:243 (+) Transcript_30925:1113-1841(+)